MTYSDSAPRTAWDDAALRSDEELMEIADSFIAACEDDRDPSVASDKLEAILAKRYPGVLLARDVLLDDADKRRSKWA